jgi:hypothetical protein
VPGGLRPQEHWFEPTHCSPYCVRDWGRVTSDLYGGIGLPLAPLEVPSPAVSEALDPISHPTAGIGDLTPFDVRDYKWLLI